MAGIRVKTPYWDLDLAKVPCPPGQAGCFLGDAGRGEELRRPREPLAVG